VKKIQKACLPLDKVPLSGLKGVVMVEGLRETPQHMALNLLRRARDKLSPSSAAVMTTSSPGC